MKLEKCFTDAAKKSNNPNCMYVPGSYLQERQKIVKERTTKIVDNYDKWALEAFSTLAYAAKKDRFDEFAKRLEDYYEANLRHIHPRVLNLMEYPWAKKAASFFKGCYRDLGTSRKEILKIR